MYMGGYAKKNLIRDYHGIQYSSKIVGALRYPQR